MSPPCIGNLPWGGIASQPATTGCPMDRHDSAWALRGKAVLIRNRWESRFGRETVLSTADLAYVVRTNDDDTRSMPEHKPPRVELGC